MKSKKVDEGVMDWLAPFGANKRKADKVVRTIGRIAKEDGPNYAITEIQFDFENIGLPPTTVIEILKAYVKYNPKGEYAAEISWVIPKAEKDIGDFARMSKDVIDERKKKLAEGSYRGDLQRLIEPELHIDQHRSKMGEDDDIIVASFKVRGKEPAHDLVSFLETGYDFILDADASPGEISPGKFLVFFELSRRTTAVDRIYQIVEEVLNLSLQDLDEWKFAYGPPEQRGTRRKVTTYPFTKENLKRFIPMSPREYRDSHEEFQVEAPDSEVDFVKPQPPQDTDDIAAMKNIAQIPVNQTAPDDDEMNALRQQAGLI